MSVRRKTNNRLILFRTCGTCGQEFSTSADSPFIRQLPRDGKRQATTYFCCESCYRASYKYTSPGKARLRNAGPGRRREIYRPRTGVIISATPNRSARDSVRHIARGIQQFVVESPNPFDAPIGYGERKGRAPIVTPFLAQYHSTMRGKIDKKIPGQPLPRNFHYLLLRVIPRCHLRRLNRQYLNYSIYTFCSFLFAIKAVIKNPPPCGGG